MRAFIEEYKSENEFHKQEGEILTKEETAKYFNDYIEDLELEDYLTLNFTTNGVIS